MDEHECDSKTPSGFAAARFEGDVWVCEHGFTYDRPMSGSTLDGWGRR